jgi:putative transposase
MQTFYQNKLPHILKEDATYFVTYRFAGSIAKPAIEKLYNEQLITERNIRLLKLSPEKQKEHIYLSQKLYFGKFDALLDKPLNGPYWLAEEPVARLVYDSLLFYHPGIINLHCFCIMSNHVHALFTPLPEAPPLHNIMKRLKSYTGKYGNELLSLSGQFWERESYDHIVRSEAEFQRIVQYILNNPVKAGLVKNWTDWRWSWCGDGLSL